MINILEILEYKIPWSKHAELIILPFFSFTFCKAWHNSIYQEFKSEMVKLELVTHK